MYDQKSTSTYLGISLVHDQLLPWTDEHLEGHVEEGMVVVIREGVLAS